MIKFVLKSSRVVASTFCSGIRKFRGKKGFLWESVMNQMFSVYWSVSESKVYFPFLELDERFGFLISQCQRICQIRHGELQPFIRSCHRREKVH